MFVHVNGARIFVDIEGAGLVPDGTAMRAKPALVLLHGGPGFDHSLFKPAFSQLADIAQIVYLDHRGNGRSSRGDPSTWNLAQWGDDVRGVCDALGIEKPIVYGVSFGGFVAQSYATRHPGHAGRLVLTSTAAKPDWPATAIRSRRWHSARPSPRTCRPTSCGSNVSPTAGTASSTTRPSGISRCCGSSSGKAERLLRPHVRCVTTREPAPSMFRTPT
jgi:pimeloyl-ACP methyl ester carboxylesterase